MRQIGRASAEITHPLIQIERIAGESIGGKWTRQ